MARRSTKYANRLLDAMFQAATEKDPDGFDKLDDKLVAEYSDECDFHEALDAMPRTLLVRWLNALKLVKPYRKAEA